MTTPRGGKHWFTAAELAELKLPGLSGVKRKINIVAAEERWADRQDGQGQAMARARAGRGGGTEYHWGVLPPAAKSALVSRGVIEVVETSPVHPDAPARDSLWAWFDLQTDKVKAEARRRLQAVVQVDQLKAGGATCTAAVAQAAAAAGVGSASVWNWLALVDGVAVTDRLPHLAPRRQGGGAQAEIHPAAWQYFLSDCLRPEEPTLSSCYERLKGVAAAQGWGDLPHLKTLQRRMEREVPRELRTLRRAGADAVRGLLPPQQRSVAGMHALEWVNIDGHRWDVFVTDGEGEPFRPMMVAIQDIYSRKFLAWRIAETESAVLTRLAFADLFSKYGIPTHVVMDNGRAFASKWITGGSKSRFRFKIRPDEPLGLLTSLGVNIHWALPFRGQSKPIERGFRDLCDTGAKHPAFGGAYTGNNPLAKPDNYRSKAVPIETFKAVVDQVMAAHNAKVGRRTEMAKARGLSFDQVFEPSYARSPIARATEEQLRLALLASDAVRTDRQSGAITLYGNRYWDDALIQIAGQKVVVRFDPDELHNHVHVYSVDGRFLVKADLLEATGFGDAGAAGRRALLERRHRKAAKELEKAAGLLSTDELAARLPEYEPDEPETPAVTRLVHLGRRGGAALAVDHHQQPERPALIDRLGERIANFDPARRRRPE